MKREQVILLPGGDKQFAHLIREVNIKNSEMLIIGSNAEMLSQLFLAEGAKSVSVIVDNHDSLVQSRYLLQNNKNISLKMMEFTRTDFISSSFDIVVAQASISCKMRNKIVKEIKRILKPDGILNVGEIVSLEENPPAFVKNIWDAGEIEPLLVTDLNEYYVRREFEVVSVKDLSNQLKEYYSNSKVLLETKAGELSDKEKSYYKKLLNRISHESNVYLKLGGDRFMGFTSIILRKKN